MSPAPDGLALDKRPLPNDSHLRQIPSSSAFVISHTGFFPACDNEAGKKIKSTPCGSLFSLLPPPSQRAKQVKSNRLDGGRRVSSAGVRAAGRQRRGPRGREEGREREALGERVGGAGRGWEEQRELFNFHSHSQMCWRQNVAFEELVAR